jgi:hypothetical protein
MLSRDAVAGQRAPTRFARCSPCESRGKRAYALRPMREMVDTATVFTKNRDRQLGRCGGGPDLICAMFSDHRRSGPRRADASRASDATTPESYSVVAATPASTISAPAA